MLKNKKLFLSFFLISLAFVSIFALGKIALASDTLGTEVIENSIVLESTDPRNITVKIINIVFGLLGVIAVSLNVYAGFLWMTSAGNEDKIEKAKKTLRNALIGLAIILASWGIVYFVFRSLFPGENTGNGQSEYRDNFFRNGLGAIGNCSVESVYPSPGATDVARNTMLMVTFREEVASSSFNMDNATVCRDEDFNVDTLECSNPVNFTVNTVDNKTFVLSTSLLGNENNSTNYVVYLSNDIISLNSGNGIFENCSNDNFTWTFSVSNRLDLTPPQVVSVFPHADNEKDIEEEFTELAYARGSFNIIGSGQPEIGVPAHLNGSVVYTNWTTSTLEVQLSPYYNDVFNRFSITISSDKKKAQMVGAQIVGGASIGGVRSFVLDIVEDGDKYKIVGYDFLTMTLDQDFAAGNSWSINIAKGVSPDSITVGGDVYYFGNGAGQIPTASASTLAANIANFINANNQNVIATQNSNTVNLQARVGGTSGNGINLSSSNPSLISATSLSGGVNRTSGITIKGKPDQPMNSIVQINFNEAINPLTVSGTSEEVKNYLRVINGSDENNIVSGKFSISSDYKTVEFKTDNKCAVNGCGEDIYCLPGSSNIKVELVAAKLFDCAGNNNNCSNKSPYSSCIANICTDDQGKFYPLASVSPISGIMDAAANSFDGNKDTYVNGPILYYDLNNPISSGNSQGSIDASYAQGSFNIIKTTVSPKTYQEVYATEVTDLSPAPAYIAVTFNRASYDGTFDEFEVSIDASGAHMVGKNSDTGVTQNLNVSLDGTRIVGYSALTMALNGYHMDQTGYIGDSWRIKINKTVVSLADSITIGNNVYEFGSGTGQIPKAKGVTLATNITNFINANNLDVTATQDSTIINLQAKVAGVSGNNITLSSSDPSLIASVAFSGGADAVASSPSSIPGDNLTWSFWTSNKIETTPPTILSVTPEIGATSTDLVSPVKMVFNKLMMMTSLRTGEVEINNGRENIVHRLVNLIAGQLVGYWISSKNLDVDPLDGVYDRTTSQIDHAKLYEGADYQAQIGSGVKDIYQNCFYPSTGMSCNLEYDRTRPYCCDGVASSTPCAE